MHETRKLIFTHCFIRRRNVIKWYIVNICVCSDQMAAGDGAGAEASYSRCSAVRRNVLVFLQYFQAQSSLLRELSELEPGLAWVRSRCHQHNLRADAHPNRESRFRFPVHTPYHMSLRQKSTLDKKPRKSQKNFNRDCCRTRNRNEEFETCVIWIINNSKYTVELNKIGFCFKFPRF